MPGRLEFGFNFGGRGAPPREDRDETPSRLLLIGDFSRRHGSPRDQATGNLTPRRIDIDRFDDVMKRIDPILELAGDNTEAAASISFHTLDDFHPDNLFARLPLFNAMQQLRSDLADPARFAEAASRLGDSEPAAPTGTQAPVADAAAATGASPLDQLLGGQPAIGGATAKTKAVGTIDRLIRDAIAPHITPGEDPRQAEYVASADLAISSQMRGVLSDPSLRSLEAAWRGVWWLVANTDPEAVEIFLLDIDRDGLAADLADANGSIARRLVDRQGSDEPPWTMLFGLFEFADTDEDIVLLSRLGELASRLGGSFVSGAAPALLGGNTWRDCIEPGVLSRSPLATGDSWQSFRTGPVATRVGLAGPRILLRLPYGPDTDEIDAFAFTELVSPEDPEAYLWGNAAIAIALLVARELSDEAGQLLLDDLPAHAYRIDGETHLTPGAECYLGERAAEAMLTAGVMPLISMRNRNAVQVLRIQSMANPATALTVANA